MRQARIRGEGVSYYHCVSRVVDRRFILGDEEREYFVCLMRKLEAFLGLRVVTYAVMSNHFHSSSRNPIGPPCRRWTAKPSCAESPTSTIPLESRHYAMNSPVPPPARIRIGKGRSSNATNVAWGMFPFS